MSASRIPTEIPQYSTQFLSVSKRLLDQGEIERLDQNSLYVQGLPEEIRRELFYRNSLNFNDDERPIDLLTLIEQAERIASLEQKFQNFFKRPEKREKFDNLIEQLRTKPDVSENRVLQAPIASPFMTAENELKDISLSMDNLINQLNAMILALSHLNASNNNNVMP